MSDFSHLDQPEFLAKLEHLAHLARKIFSGELFVDTKGRGKKGAGILFQDYRSYSSGDDFRSVDWNLYGRLGELFVKVFEPEERSSIDIFLDCSPSMGDGKKKQLSVELTAAFGYIGLLHLDRVRVIPFPFQEALEFEGARNLLPLLRTLQTLNPQGEGDLATAVHKTFKGKKKSGAFDLIFSDFYPAKVVDQALIRLAGHALCIHLIDPSDIEFQGKGATQFEDPESLRRRWIGVTKQIRARYQNLVQAHLREIANIAARNRAGYVRVSSEDPFDAAALKILTRGKF